MTSHVGILPDDVLDALIATLNKEEAGLSQSDGIRFLRLPHPRTGIPSLFLPYRCNNGTMRILEMQAVMPPNKRSWMFTEGNITEDGKLLVMTPIDPAFLLIPLLQCIQPVDGTQVKFRPIDDIFDDAAPRLAKMNSISKDPSAITSIQDIQCLSTFDSINNAMKRVCEFKQITEDIVVYRYTPSKLVEYLKGKVARLASPETFEKSRTLIRNLAKEGLMEDGKETLLESARIRAACDLVAQYIPQDVYDALLASYDFIALDAHLKTSQDELAALAAANMSRAEAKESKTIENAAVKGKKRKGSSHGVEQLKKANVKGMSKISSFFQKSTS